MKRCISVSFAKMQNLLTLKALYIKGFMVFEMAFRARKVSGTFVFFRGCMFILVAIAVLIWFHFSIKRFYLLR